MSVPSFVVLAALIACGEESTAAPTRLDALEAGQGVIPELQADLADLQAARDELQAQVDALSASLDALIVQLEGVSAAALTLEDVSGECSTVVAADTTVARKNTGQDFTWTYGTFSRVDTDVTWRTPDGVEHYLDTTGMADGELRVNADDTIALQNGAAGANSVLYLNLDQMPSIDCALFASDDDTQRVTLFATDANSSGLWSDGLDHWQVQFSREGNSGDLPDQNANYKVVCF